MASFPSAKVHRVNRRKLGRGQYPSIPSAVLTVTLPSSTTVLISSSVPLVYLPNIPLTITGGGPVTAQNQISQTDVELTLTGAGTGEDWSVPSNIGTTFQGGGTAAASGTF